MILALLLIGVTALQTPRDAPPPRADTAVDSRQGLRGRDWDAASRRAISLIPAPESADVARVGVVSFDAIRGKGRGRRQPSGAGTGDRLRPVSRYRLVASWAARSRSPARGLGTARPHDAGRVLQIDKGQEMGAPVGWRAHRVQQSRGHVVDVGRADGPCHWRGVQARQPPDPAP